MIPKVIHTLWIQGASQAPDVVKLCFRRWLKLNPGYELRVLEAADVRALLAGFPVPLESISVQALSDIVRIRLLAEAGGVWTDATVLPVKPLDDWLPQQLGSAGFFAFEKPKPDRPLASWFLASEANHTLTRKWCQEVFRFWLQPRTLTFYDGNMVPPDPDREVAPGGGASQDRYPYFWFHYLFGYLLRADPAFAGQWSRCGKIGAEPPHRLQMLFSKSAARPSAADVIATAQAAPVQKLNWRQPYPLDLLESL